MKIISLDVSASFRYLWLKTVTDVNLFQHCSSCLIGEYNPQINTKIKHLENIELPNNVHYLCGVAIPYVWDNNFHLAFAPSKGNTVLYESNGIKIEIQDAVQLPISTEYLNIHHPKFKFKTYSTCRNWQFAHYFNEHLK